MGPKKSMASIALCLATACSQGFDSRVSDNKAGPKELEDKVGDGEEVKGEISQGSDDGDDGDGLTTELSNLGEFQLTELPLAVGSRFSVDWTKSDDATEYVVSLATDAECKETVDGSKSTVDSLVHTFEGVQAGEHFVCLVATATDMDDLAVANQALPVKVAPGWQLVPGTSPLGTRWGASTASDGERVFVWGGGVAPRG
jgi:hypothetical protein